MAFKNWEIELTPENLKEEIARAKAAGEKADATQPRAESVHYDKSDDLIVIRLRNGAIFSFPPKLAQGLEGASPEQLADIWIPPSGSSVHWESLDVDFSIPELIAGIFGTKSWMAELGRKGGQATSSAKSAAARKNGKKGGRPRKNNTLASKEG
jgi:DNA invertase Pin-like site-specific DNA recombinase